MSIVDSLSYSLNPSPRKASWTTGQEKVIANDFPFDLINQQESPESYVTRTYLQFLWLPKSIMPLNLLIPSLRQVKSHPDQTMEPHPLHAFLDPLLLTTRLVANKYHTELPKILAADGGSGEIEEMIMWYSLSYEKSDNEEEEDHAWRGRWLKSLERRETQIQILLYMLKLSLPSPPSPPEPQSKQRKRKRKRGDATSEVEDISSIQDRLEEFMDKLSMWQLVDEIRPPDKPKPYTRGGVYERDWAQVFCEDIVEVQFKTLLPQMCSLLRSKVFPTSPFSDEEDASSSRSHSRSTSPNPQPEGQFGLDKPKLLKAKPRALSRTASNPSRAGSSTASSKIIPTGRQSSILSDKNPNPRERSRSLSVSLAQERERAGSVGVIKKRVLNREVSMSRVFKPKPKPRPQIIDRKQPGKSLQRSKTMSTIDKGMTLVEETPVKSRSKLFRSVSLASENKDSRKAVGVVGRSSDTLFPASSINEGGGNKEEEEDEVWELPVRTPAMLLLRSSMECEDEGGREGRTGFDDTDEDDDYNLDLTPCKPPRKR